jgi:hypothetical protein
MEGMEGREENLNFRTEGKPPKSYEDDCQLSPFLSRKVSLFSQLWQLAPALARRLYRLSMYLCLEGKEEKRFDL